MDILNTVHDIFGVRHQELLIWHMLSRVIFIYVLGIVLVHINKRFMAIRTPYNFFLFIFIGSILATSVVGTLFYEIVGMVIIITFLNWFIVVLNYCSSSIRRVITGVPILLIDDGILQHKNLKKCFVREEELISLLRIQTNTDDLRRVEKSYFETNGQISFILKQNHQK